MSVSRRHLIKFGAGFIGTASLANVLGLKVSTPETAVAQNELSPEQALEKLMEGNQRFVERGRKCPNQNFDRLTGLAEGQYPFASIISCSDSRVPVEIIFDRGFGDIFVVRDAGNVATPEEIGSLEFGTLLLGSKVVMVLGHESCGAVKAALQGDKVPGQIENLLAQIKPAVESFRGQQENKDAVEQAVKANVLFQLERLKLSPIISRLINEEKLKVVGAYYDLNEGKVSLIS